MLASRFWNIGQNLAELLEMKPLDCQCNYCDPGLTFDCARCNRLRAYCWGCADADFPLCDTCWADKQIELESAKTIST